MTESELTNKRPTFHANRVRKQKEAKERQEYRNMLSSVEQLKRLDKRPGKSARERARLKEKINGSEKV